MIQISVSVVELVGNIRDIYSECYLCFDVIRKRKENNPSFFKSSFFVYIFFFRRIFCAVSSIKISLLRLTG